MIYGYARVSSTSQLKGHGLEVQETALREAGCQQVWKEQFTGHTMEREKWSKLFKRLKRGDTLVACKLDRIARTTEEGISNVRELMERGVTVKILNMGTVDDTPMGRLVLTVMMAFAEFERDLIVERTAAGREAAKAANPDFKCGRKPIAVDMDALREAVELHGSGEITNVEAAEMAGLSLRTYQRRRHDLLAS